MASYVPAPRTLTAFVALGVLATVGASAHAQLLLDQTPDFSLRAYVSDLTTNEELASAFAFSAPTHLTHIDWWGTANRPIDLDPANFRLRLYDDVGGVPSPTLYSPIAFTNFTRTDTGHKNPDHLEVYDYAVDVNLDVAANATKYFEVVNQFSQWGWQSSGPGTLWGHFGDGTVWGTYINTDGLRALALQGTTSVPEPGSMALCVSLLCTVGLLVKRRRQRG